MLLLAVRNDRQQFEHRHGAGQILLGRSPDPDMPHVVIDDQYVSRRQVRLKEMQDGSLRFENLGRNDLELSDGTRIRQGESCRITPPISLRVGRTRIELAIAQEGSRVADLAASSDVPSAYKTVSLPVQRQQATTVECSLASLGQAPPAGRLASWFETLLSVHRSAVGSAEFYEETARALVDLVGLDRGLVLLRRDDDCEVVAGYTRNEDAGLAYSKSIVSDVLSRARTFYGNPKSMSARDSLEDLEAVVASPIFGEHGDVVGVLFGSRDCGSDSSSLGIQSLEAQVVQLLACSVTAGLVRTQMQERLKQAEQLAAVGQAIGYILHDLRGPLGNVQQLLELLRADQQEPLGREEQLELIDESLAFSLDLLNDSLEVCRGVVHIDRVRGRFCNLLDKHLRLLRMDLESLGVRLQLDIPDDAEVYLDPNRMARVLRNLATNAGEALQGRPDALVSIGVRKVAAGTTIYVSDNGPGLPDEMQHRLFRPFATHGKRGGTGFGLAIARQLVEAHAGRISVVSGTKGTRFTISLPKDELEDSDATTITPRTTPAHENLHQPAEATSARTHRILLAEDGLVNQRLIGSLLRNAGHAVTIANNGREAFEAWQADRFDLVLMDVEMPELDGLAAARLIREQESAGARHIPIVALTAHASDESHAQCLDAGMTAILRKPVRTSDLLQLIQELG